MSTTLEMNLDDDGPFDEDIDERDYYQFNDIGLPLRIAALRDIAEA